MKIVKESTKTTDDGVWLVREYKNGVSDQLLVAPSQTYINNQSKFISPITIKEEERKTAWQVLWDEYQKTCDPTAILQKLINNNGGNVQHK